MNRKNYFRFHLNQIYKFISHFDTIYNFIYKKWLCLNIRMIYQHIL
jgi:hypothetical protein